MPKNNSLALPAILLNSVIKTDAFWLYDPLYYLSWVDDKRVSYSMDESLL